MKSKMKEVHEDLIIINKCSCYDEDCKDVSDPAQCFLGFPGISDIGIADGYCQESLERSQK